MSLIIETGAGLPNSESYASVVDVDAYLSARGITIWAPLLEEEKEQALRRAAQYMVQKFRARWQGTRVVATQAQDWPRYNVRIKDLINTSGYVVMHTTIPSEVLAAQCELALLAAAGDLNPPKETRIASNQVGPIKVVYDLASPDEIQYPHVIDILASLFKSGGGNSLKLHRV